MVEQICPVCEQQRVAKVQFFEEYRVEFCAQCGHGITLPVLTSTDLDRLYDERYFSELYEPCFAEKRYLQRKIRQEDHRLRLLGKHCSQGKVLDVGCGRGFFLYACKERYRPYGFDVSSNNKEYIEQQLGVELFTAEQELLKLSSAEGLFEAITFWHSLEHFTDPAATLGSFCSLLQDEGVLIIEVPIHDSIDAGMKGEAWEGWHIPYHRHHFSSRSLQQFLRDMGLDIVAAHSYHSGHVYERLKTRWYLQPFARSAAKLFGGGSMVVACRKAG
ncbi:class I SAM-dependent methyltransferase [Desulfogranum mediterraneum]|uniref:class I SAM-dependent methyltransferase n=1 Tax=Desulfogranum mediterraneum TaxID=160661 RepID=UPI000429C7CD|nr:class I SAM-dependent methyltransferase [Desulfogranum mediterraneum]